MAFLTPTVACTQVLQFRPAVWDIGSGGPDPRPPLIPGDTSGAATAINDNGQIVGISGICDQAVGRHTAKHAVLWENGGVTNIGNLGDQWWNTPTASINTAMSWGLPAIPPMLRGNILHAFIWTKDNGIKALKPLRGRVPQHVDSEAYGINEAQQVVGVSCDADRNDCRPLFGITVSTPQISTIPISKATILAFSRAAKDINNKGEITGRAIDSSTGALIAYLAVPVNNDEDGMNPCSRGATPPLSGVACVAVPRPGSERGRHRLQLSFLTLQKLSR